METVSTIILKPTVSNTVELKACSLTQNHGTSHGSRIYEIAEECVKCISKR